VVADRMTLVEVAQDDQVGLEVLGQVPHDPPPRLFLAKLLLDAAIPMACPMRCSTSNPAMSSQIDIVLRTMLVTVQCHFPIWTCLGAGLAFMQTLLSGEIRTGVRFQHCPTNRVPKMDEHDTQGVLALCEQARKTTRPEHDRAISQIFALNLDRCRIPGRAAWVTRNIDLRLTVRISSQSRSVISRSGWGRLMPALFTRMSMPPSAMANTTLSLSTGASPEV
jgi:hypothetical protein